MPRILVEHRHFGQRRATECGDERTYGRRGRRAALVKTTLLSSAAGDEGVYRLSLGRRKRLGGAPTDRRTIAANALALA